MTWPPFVFESARLDNSPFGYVPYVQYDFKMQTITRKFIFPNLDEPTRPTIVEGITWFKFWGASEGLFSEIREDPKCLAGMALMLSLMADLERANAALVASDQKFIFFARVLVTRSEHLDQLVKDLQENA